MEPRELVLALKALGLTQKQIEERTGIPQPTVSKIERGDVSDVMSRSYRALLALHTELKQADNHTAKAGA
jgi:transcriptional regulator with XRE-family HTH domain